MDPDVSPELASQCLDTQLTTLENLKGRLDERLHGACRARLDRPLPLSNPTLEARIDGCEVRT